MKLTVREEAENDAISAMLNYHDIRAKLGVQFRERLRTIYDSIAFNRHQFSKVSHRLVEGDVRIAKLKQFPYVVVYEILPDEVVVYSVTRAHRDDLWLARLPQCQKEE